MIKGIQLAYSKALGWKKTFREGSTWIRLTAGGGHEPSQWSGERNVYAISYKTYGRAQIIMQECGNVRVAWFPATQMERVFEGYGLSGNMEKPTTTLPDCLRDRDSKSMYLYCFGLDDSSNCPVCDISLPKFRYGEKEPIVVVMLRSKENLLTVFSAIIK